MTNASINSPFRRSVGFFLIGFMGSGKTHWGKIWARQTGFTFFDLDAMIEEKEGATISSIFETKGEKYFRDAETDMLTSFSQKNNFIAACGGGAACFNNNMQWMNENGTTIYLGATPQNIFERVERGRHKRPLISKLNDQELLFFIEHKLQEREPFYKQAKFILPVTELNENSLSNLNF